jgi:hypothetical protein
MCMSSELVRKVEFNQRLFNIWGTMWRSWLRHYATSPNIAGSIFHGHNPSGRTMAQGLTQSPTEMSTRNISWGGGGGWRGSECVGLTTLPLSFPDCLKIWEPQPPGTLRVCTGL